MDISNDITYSDILFDKCTDSVRKGIEPLYLIISEENYDKICLSKDFGELPYVGPSFKRETIKVANFKVQIVIYSGNPELFEVCGEKNFIKMKNMLCDILLEPTGVYYTPAAEDFRIGFEYELLEDFDVLPEKIWHKQVYGTHGTNPERLDSVNLGNMEGKIRVPYLTVEQVEEEGWIVDRGEIATKGDWILILFIPEVFGKHKIEIRHGDPSNAFGNFLGECKSINEFRTIQKWLGIK